MVDDPNVSVLLDTMDATGQWPATLRLRAWEREQLSLVEGQRLLDVGCGLGEARVVRPGGRVSLIDTDWSTLAIDVGDSELASRVRRAMRVERNRPSNIRSRLHDLVQTAGLTPLARTAQTHTWTEWNPDESPAPDGCFSMESLADDIVTADQVAPDERAAFVSTIRTAALRNQFSMSLTMFAVIAAAP